MALRLELMSAAAAWVVGVVVGAMCALMAFVLVPEVGVCGDTNAEHARVPSAWPSPGSPFEQRFRPSPERHDENV